MKPYRFHILGIQILLLACTAQSFVMLTANMEDIKKLARKFVSDDLADKIAEFVVKATEQMTTGLNNLSDENDLNLQDNISDDNTKYKLRMAQNEKKPERAPKDYREDKYDRPRDYNKDRNQRPDTDYYNKEYKQEYTTKRYDEHRGEAKISEDRNEAKNNDRDRESKMKKWYKDTKERSRERHSEELPPKKYNRYSEDERDQKVQKYYHPEKERLDRVPLKSEGRNNKNRDDIPAYEEKYKLRDTTERFKIVKSKNSNELLESGEMRPANQKDESPYRQRVTDATHKAAPTIDFIKPDKNQLDSSSNLGGFRGLRASNFEFTTEKEKTDFDQYDNINYPKAAKFVATSGPVMLPKMPNKNWWLNGDAVRR